MRRSIIVLEKELVKVQELMKECGKNDCTPKWNLNKCQLYIDKQQLSKDIQTLYTGK